MPYLPVFLNAILWILAALEWIVVVWVVLSWILFFLRDSKFRWRHRGFYQVLAQLDDIFTRMTYPFLAPFRRLLHRVNTAGIDWSPLLLLLCIFIVRGLVLAFYGAILFR